jgi:hypothetical protein
MMQPDRSIDAELLGASERHGQHFPRGLPYVSDAPHVREELLMQIARGKTLSPAEARMLRSDVAAAAAKMRERREAFEAATGRLVFVEPPTEP